MDENTKDFLDRNKISTYNVMYILRNGRKSLLHLDTGKDVETYIPIKKILKELNSSNFEIINRGIVISTRFVSKVEKSVYTMTDGKQFVGRIRTCKSQIEEIKEKSQQNIESVENEHIEEIKEENEYIEESNEKVTVEKILHEEMEGACSLAVNLDIDVHSGNTWYDAK